jgi:hypothetical protein
LTKKQRDALALGPAAGGKAVRDRTPPAVCPHCNRDMRSRSWHQYLGHLSVHKLGANNGWSYKRAAYEFKLKGLQAQDPAPWNGAFSNAHEGTGMSPYVKALL